jgi:hypothetical protein
VTDKNLPALFQKKTPPANAGSEVNQSENFVLGDLAGDSIHKTTYTINLPAPPAESRLNRLYRRMAEEANDPKLTEYIGQLEIFTRVVQDEDVIGVQQKLEAATRGDEVTLGEAMKEMIFAEIRQNKFSRSFQQIYATLMGRVHALFTQFVTPAIQAGASRMEIDSLVFEKIIQPVAAELEDCPDCTDAPETTVRGMLYFLTGNCHIRWHAC